MCKPGEENSSKTSTASGTRMRLKAIRVFPKIAGGAQSHGRGREQSQGDGQGHGYARA